MLTLLCSRRFSCGLAVAILLFLGAGIAPAGIISFTNETVDLSGQGFGSVPPVLTLQTHGSQETSEWGSVGWNGTADVYSGPSSQVETGKSQTISVADLLSLGLTKDNFGLVFNINQPGGMDVVVHAFSVDFYLADGTLSSTAVYTPPSGGLSLSPTGQQGQGGAGYLFRVDLSSSEFASLTADPNNRLGMTVLAGDAIGNAAAGAESFTMAPVVPEPATLVLLSLGLLALRRRR